MNISWNVLRRCPSTLVICHCALWYRLSGSGSLGKPFIPLLLSISNLSVVNLLGLFLHLAVFRDATNLNTGWLRYLEVWCLLFLFSLLEILASLQDLSRRCLYSACCGYYWLCCSLCLNLPYLCCPLADVKDVGYVIVSVCNGLFYHYELTGASAELRLPEQLRGLRASYRPYWGMLFAFKRRGLELTRL